MFCATHDPPPRRGHRRQRSCVAVALRAATSLERKRRRRLQVDRVDPDRRPALESVRLVLELQHAAGADVGAHAAADAGGALDVHIGLGVGADVDAHFAVGRAVPAGGAHVLLDRLASRPSSGRPTLASPSHKLSSARRSPGVERDAGCHEQPRAHISSDLAHVEDDFPFATARPGLSRAPSRAARALLGYRVAAGTIERRRSVRLANSFAGAARLDALELSRSTGGRPGVVR